MELGGYMGVNPKIGGFDPQNVWWKFHGKPYEQMDHLGGFPPYFWFNTHMHLAILRLWPSCLWWKRDPWPKTSKWPPTQGIKMSRLESPGIYIYIYIPGTQMTSIFEGQPPKTRPFPIKTRVIWVPGIYIYVDIVFFHFWFFDFLNFRGNLAVLTE